MAPVLFASCSVSTLSDDAPSLALLQQEALCLSWVDRPHCCSSGQMLPHSCTAFAVASRHYSRFPFALHQLFRRSDGARDCPNAAIHVACLSLRLEATQPAILTPIVQRSPKSACCARKAARSLACRRTPLLRVNLPPHACSDCAWLPVVPN